MKGGEIINQGAYGCVTTPAYNCKSKPIKNLDNYVSKLLKKKPIDSSEAKFGTLFNKIDPNNKHFIYVTNNCMIDINEISNEDKKYCKINSTTVENYILKKGGHDLSKVSVDVTTAIKFTKQILKSMKKLVSNNIIHLDIKRPNIITDIKGKNTFIIDFGSDFIFTSFSKFNTFFDIWDFNHLRFKWGTYIWAPEIFRRIFNYNGEDKNIKDWGDDDAKFNVTKSQVLVINEYIKQLGPKNWKLFCEKVMIYSLGLALNNFYTHNINPAKSSIDKQKLLKLKNVIDRMYIIDPFQRITINEALKLLINPRKIKPIALSPIFVKIPKKESPKPPKSKKRKTKSLKKTKSIKKKSKKKINTLAKPKSKNKSSKKKTKSSKKKTKSAKKPKKPIKSTKKKTKSLKKITNKKLCKEFLDNNKINPLTNRKIKHNGPTYKKLLKLCKK